ncbi:alpha/beta fold hydrolase [Hoeflea prorocentri]|uniref:Alpha/beta hydrolase n=1 Tax=Hoeflea prorocentri TaxID=1922333 RepID=A0A9X3ZIC0_9HYPH|nr:alpha/beta hydrolase [Hoeflea prorocentri]MCY6382767.1 alpha/beta hydrolase [Hoeflea prorocentri]MDA5400567.1 alpha/beta hydrolase [Hoeflea prorocentri]
MDLPGGDERMPETMHEIGGEQIFVADSGGDLPALLFIHGTMMDGTVWDKQVAVFRDRYRCVCPDLRGHGRSTARSPDISFEDHCDDLNTLIEELSLKDITLLGWSMGGCITQVFVTRYPGVVSRLVLIDTIPQRLSDEHFPYGQDPGSTPKTRHALETNFEATARGFGPRIAPEDEAVAAYISDLAARARQDVTINDYVTTDERSQIGLLPHITLPTTIVSGDRDLVCKPGASTFMAEHIPGCTDGVHVIAGAGHAPFLTHADEFNAILSNALEAHDHARG